MNRLIRFRSALTVAALLLAASTALAQEPWQRLPPMPDLPKGTVGEHLEIHGARLWYARWNATAGGAPVLLLHGGYGNSSYFGHLIPALVGHGYSVIAVDSRGHGRSTAPDEQITYHLMAADVLGLLDHLKIAKVSLVGWSDGGVTGFDLAINEYRNLSPTPDRWAAFNANVNRMWETLPAFTADQLRSIRVPTTIADGEYDEGIKPEHNRYLASTIPGAKLVILPNVSHFAMLQNPPLFNRAVLDFLQGPGH